MEVALFSDLDSIKRRRRLSPHSSLCFPAWTQCERLPYAPAIMLSTLIDFTRTLEPVKLFYLALSVTATRKVTTTLWLSTSGCPELPPHRICTRPQQHSDPQGQRTLRDNGHKWTDVYKKAANGPRPLAAQLTRSLILVRKSL